MAADMAALTADLAAESADLDRVLAALPDDAWSTATPTGRPYASPLALTKPVRMSTGLPDGAPLANGMKTTL